MSQFKYVGFILQTYCLFLSFSLPFSFSLSLSLSLSLLPCLSPTLCQVICLLLVLTLYLTAEPLGLKILLGIQRTLYSLSTSSNNKQTGESSRVKFITRHDVTLATPRTRADGCSHGQQKRREECHVFTRSLGTRGAYRIIWVRLASRSHTPVRGYWNLIYAWLPWHDVQYLSSKQWWVFSRRPSSNKVLLTSWSSFVICTIQMS